MGSRGRHRPFARALGLFRGLRAIAAAFGVGALVLTTTATIASTFLIAGFMIFVGGAESPWARRASLEQQAAAVLLGLLYIVAGAFVIARPLTGADGFTLLLGAALLAAGVARVLFARAPAAWPGPLRAARRIVTTLLGLMILFGWPENRPSCWGFFWASIFVAMARAGSDSLFLRRTKQSRAVFPKVRHVQMGLQFLPRRAEGDASMKALLGGKGANLAEMAASPARAARLHPSPRNVTYFYPNGKTLPRSSPPSSTRRSTRARRVAGHAFDNANGRCSCPCARVRARRCRA